MVCILAYSIDQRIGDYVVVVCELRQRQPALLVQRLLQVGGMARHLARDRNAANRKAGVAGNAGQGVWCIRENRRSNAFTAPFHVGHAPIQHGPLYVVSHAEQSTQHVAEPSDSKQWAEGEEYNRDTPFTEARRSGVAIVTRDNRTTRGKRVAQGKSGPASPFHSLDLNARARAAKAKHRAIPVPTRMPVNSIQSEIVHTSPQLPELLYRISYIAVDCALGHPVARMIQLKVYSLPPIVSLIY